MMTGIIVTNGVTAVAPINTNRTWAIIENIDLNPIFFQLGNTSSGLTITNGLELVAGGIVSLTKSSPLSDFGFSINAISSVVSGVNIRYQDDT
jgi:hypothetical protein